MKRMLRVIVTGVGLFLFAGGASALTCPFGSQGVSYDMIHTEGHAYSAQNAIDGFVDAQAEADAAMDDSIEFYADRCEQRDDGSLIVGTRSYAHGSPDSACIFFGGAFDCSQFISLESVCCAPSH